MNLFLTFLHKELKVLRSSVKDIPNIFLDFELCLGSAPTFGYKYLSKFVIRHNVLTKNYCKNRILR